MNEELITCSVCGQKYYQEDMVLILDGKAVCRFCSEPEAVKT